MPRLLSYSREEQELMANEFDILLFLGYTWTAIANHFNVNRSTLMRYRIHIGYVERLVRIDDDNLDAMVTTFIVNHPETGSILIQNIILNYILFIFNFLQRSCDVERGISGTWNQSKL